MDEAAEALFAVYGSDASASVAFGRVIAQLQVGSLAVIDVGIVRRGHDGKVAVERPPAAAPSGVAQPSAVAGLVGLIFPPSAMVTSVVGHAIGMVATHLKRTGVDGASLRRLGAVLDPGESALLVVADHSAVPAAERALNGFAHLVRSKLGSPEPAPA
jgi:uncharacterized membrane protein